jgi:hypothetical protein
MGEYPAPASAPLLKYILCLRSELKYERATVTHVRRNNFLLKESDSQRPPPSDQTLLINSGLPLGLRCEVPQAGVDAITDLRVGEDFKMATTLG